MGLAPYDPWVRNPGSGCKNYLLSAIWGLGMVMRMREIRNDTDICTYSRIYMGIFAHICANMRKYVYISASFHISRIRSLDPRWLTGDHFYIYIYVFMDCMAVETVRQREGIRSFFDECRCAGLSSVSSFRHYIAGLDTNGTKIDVKAHLSRGGCLLKLTEAWLDIWEPRD